jgi:hypothetical protein
MSKVKSWIRDNYAHLKIVDHLSDRIKAFEAACGKETPEEYIYKACRLAVAHANNPSSSDPDDLNELTRLQ